MRVFVAGGNSAMRDTAILVVLDSIAKAHKITFVAFTRVCPVGHVIERWAFSRGLLSGTLAAPNRDVFWDMVDCIVALPGAPQSLIDSARDLGRAVWYPFEGISDEQTAKSQP